MQARIKNLAFAVPGTMQALQALAALTDKGRVPKATLNLVHLRASQINGCAVCLDLHARGALRASETDERLLTVAAWHDSPYFSDAERAALALTEAVTRLSDRTDPVPDAIWDEAAKHYDERQLSALVLQIAVVNVWNRLNVATRQVAGEWARSAEGQKRLESRDAAEHKATAHA
jgi:AhpD family alkylhydroperoxidase